ncbi:VTT domain-containing protein [Gammaproteobacteria bacterium]|nr:VTT domain-containing protein [Gammaproteobacteria bacterium]
MNIDLSHLSSFIEHHLEIGIFIAGFIAFIESLAIIGSIIPGSVMMTMIGLLLGRGLLPLNSTLFAVFIGALIGDYISYWLGKYYQDDLLEHRWVKPYYHWIQHGQAFIQQYGTMSILVGRFVGPMRSLVPLVAGLLNMQVIRFTIAIFPTAMLWTIVYLTPGFLIGALASEASNIDIFKLAGYTLAFSSMAAIWYAIPTLCKKMNLQYQTRTHQFCVVSLAHALKGIIAFLMAMIIIYSDLSTQSWVDTLNISIDQISQALLQSYHPIAVLTANLHSPWAYLGIILCSSIILRKHRRFVLYCLSFTLTLFALTLISKLYVPSVRPEHYSSDYGLPSGHVILIPTLILLLSQSLSVYSSALAMLGHRIGILSLIIASISRIILSQHFATQVIASAFLSMSITHVFGALKPLWFKHIPKEKLKPLIYIQLVTMLISSMLMPYFHTHEPKTLLPLEFETVPIIREGLVYGSNEPINAHIYLSEESTKDLLLALGWKQHLSQNTNCIQQLMQSPYPYNANPLIHPRFNGHPPVLTFSKRIENKTFILRLWRVMLKESVMIGTISLDIEPDRLFSVNNLTCDITRYNINTQPLDLLKYGTIKFRETTDNKEQWQPYCFNGATLIIHKGL